MDEKDGHDVQAFAGDLVELHHELAAAAAGRDVWVAGGGDVAVQFAVVGLIDEMIVMYAPCPLGAGARVLPLRSEWALREVAATPTSSVRVGRRRFNPGPTARRSGARIPAT